MEDGSIKANEDSLKAVVQEEDDEPIVEVLGFESADEINDDLVECLDVKGEDYVLIDIDNDSNDMIEDVFMPEEGYVNVSNDIVENVEAGGDIPTII